MMGARPLAPLLQQLAPETGFGRLLGLTLAQSMPDSFSMNGCGAPDGVRASVHAGGSLPGLRGSVGEVAEWSNATVC